MSPIESPVTDVVVYDGDCGICEASGRWITAHVPNVAVVSHHQYGLDQIDAVWFVTGARRFEGAPAIAQILRRAESRVLRGAGFVIGLPLVRTVAAVVYLLVARNRRRLSVMLGMRACGIQPPTASDSSHR